MQLGAYTFTLNGASVCAALLARFSAGRGALQSNDLLHSTSQHAMDRASDSEVVVDSISSQCKDDIEVSDENGIPLPSTRPEVTSANDVVGLRDHDEQDSFSTFLEQKALQWFPRHIVSRFSESAQKKNKLSTYKSRTALRVTALTTTIVACSLPILSISVLYPLKSMKGRQGAIAGFNVLLSVCLGVFTTAKRVEKSGVTAAFAAVQVVFVSSNGVAVM
ncbi:hypothetical protein E2P81_ATG09446 [Venturia nashicola]|uniref:DUF6594 domain-containing protein n=1 Tax=Venturia nashicola TaxID=86259 RepID=A0A4Z1NLY6_9PEZI|nr:hypothetical protein E6O75_ATG09655 [Venturia nashicola]TLD25789.1 hypothetical protein E2P81_ATG09446 [Venturia nashicola]